MPRSIARRMGAGVAHHPTAQVQKAAAQSLLHVTHCIALYLKQDLAGAQFSIFRINGV